VAPAVKVAAEELGLEVVQPRSAKKPEFAEAMRQTGADVGVVVAYGKILPTAVLEAFPFGCLNIHGSILPRYRGAAPIQRAVMDGNRETGVTIMQLDEGMDTGPMLSVVRMPIADDDTAATVFERMAPLGAKALLDTLEQLEAGTASATPQDDSQASHAAMLSKADGAVDWSREARLVSAHMRGVDPWPGAFSELEGERIKLFSPVVTEGSGEPGAIIGVGKGGIEIACGQGAVRVREVQAPGKKRMSAADFARGRRLEPGPRFQVS
jgi:methionyl-tRNA formyltransferase